MGVAHSDLGCPSAELGQGRDRHTGKTPFDPSMALATDPSGQQARDTPPLPTPHRSVTLFPVLLRLLLHSEARSGTEAVSPPVLTLPLALPLPCTSSPGSPGSSSWQAMGNVDRGSTGWSLSFLNPI